MITYMTVATAVLVAAASPLVAVSEDGDLTQTRLSGMSDVESVTITTGQSTLISLGERIERVVVVDDRIADAEPVDADEVLLIGRAPGTTDVVFRLESGDTVCRRLEVGFNAEALEMQLRRLFGVYLSIEEVGGTIALRGVMPDLETAGLVAAFMDDIEINWIDLSRIPGVRQVQLRVRIAEASRSALRQLAFGGVIGGSNFFGGVQSPGGSAFQSAGISPAAAGAATGAEFDLAKAKTVSSATTLFAGVPGADLEIFLEALDENRYVRMLAEPNLVASSGEEATFLVGGEFPIPITQGGGLGGGQAVTIEYKEYGVRLVFRPEVLGDGLIRLEVAPEVSELSELGAVDLNGYKVPGVTTRRSSTTVELGSGQSFALAGLIRTFEQGKVSRIPLLGDIPLLGTLFRSVRYQKDQTELVVIVTAELVEPLDNGRELPVPGDLHVTPDDWELFVEGRVDGKIEFGSPLARLDALGLDGLVGPGAWRRPDEERKPAADPMPVSRDSTSDGSEAGVDSEDSEG